MSIKAAREVEALARQHPGTPVSIRTEAVQVFALCCLGRVTWLVTSAEGAQVIDRAQAIRLLTGKAVLVFEE